MEIFRGEADGIFAIIDPLCEMFDVEIATDVERSGKHRTLAQQPCQLYCSYCVYGINVDGCLNVIGPNIRVPI